MPKKSSASRAVKYIQPTLASEPVEVDPNAKGTIIRWALGLEGVANIVTGAWMMFFPTSFMSMLVPKPSEITPAALACTQHFGAMMFAITTPMLLAIPNTRRAIESRQSVYYLIGSSEVAIISLALYQAYGPSKNIGFSQESMVSLVKQIGPAFLWRVFVLFVKPEWLGRYREDRKQN